MMKSLATAGALVLTALSGPPAHAQSPAPAPTEDVRALQGRLVDAGCYNGPVNGISADVLNLAKQACPYQEPLFRIDPGSHLGEISASAIDGACNILATLGDDNTVRLWNTETWNLMRTIRFPDNPKAEGRLYALTFSRNGKWIASAGHDLQSEINQKFGIYRVHVEDGMFSKIGAVEAPVRSIAYSPDGRWIAVGLFWGGLRVIDSGTGNEIWRDDKYKLPVSSLAFSNSGTLYALSLDGDIKKYRLDGRIEYSNTVKRATAETDTSAIPGILRLSPRGDYIAVGYVMSNAPIITLLNANTLEYTGNSKYYKGETGWYDALDWAPDQSYIVASGTAGLMLKTRPLRYIDLQNGAIIDIQTGNQRITSINSCAKKDITILSESNIATSNFDGKIKFNVPGSILSYAAAGLFMSVDSSGARVTFGGSADSTTPNHGNLLFDVMVGKLSNSAHMNTMANVRKDMQALIDHETSTSINGHDFPRLGLESKTSVRIVDNGSIIIGTTNGLYFASKTGDTYWSQRTSGASSIVVPPDHRLIVVMHHDGTIRWYRWSDGKELLALFVHARDHRWVAWTPSGYYMASPGGEDLIGWQVNRGWSQAPDFFPASRFRDKFSRPDIVKKVLVTLDEDKAVAEANAEANRRQDDRPIEALLPPVVTISAPRSGDRFSGGKVTLNYTVRSPSGLKVDAIDVLIDGRPLNGTRGLGRTDLSPEVTSCLEDVASRGFGRSDDKTCRMTLAVPSHDVEIDLIARSGRLSSTPARVQLVYAGPAQTALPTKPTLHVLAIGVADYADPGLRLELAGKDATDFATAIEGQNGKLYRSVNVRRVVDREATRVAVLNGLEWLETQVRQGDTAMVFMAGHGITDEKGTFWFLPADATASSLRATAISQDDLKRTLTMLPGKAILFLDTCQAGRAASTVVAKGHGAVDMNLVVNDFGSAENGIVTFASSTGREESQESSSWGNGAFTRALLEGLSGKADLLRKGEVTLTGLEYYVASRVKDMTADAQHPVMNKPPTIPDYPLARLQ